MNLFSIIKDHEKAFIDICVSHKVETLNAFGSSVTQYFDEETSDIDLLITLNIIDPIEYGEALLSIWDEFELLFNRKVDLLSEDSITNLFLKNSIDANKKLIYDNKREKVFS